MAVSQSASNTSLEYLCKQIYDICDPIISSSGSGSTDITKSESWESFKTSLENCYIALLLLQLQGSGNAYTSGTNLLNGLGSRVSADVNSLINTTYKAWVTDQSHATTRRWYGTLQESFKSAIQEIHKVIEKIHVDNAKTYDVNWVETGVNKVNDKYLPDNYYEVYKND